MTGTFNDGAAYERLMGRWSRKTGRLLLDWLDVAPGLDWLDVGCGNGAFTEEVIARCKPRAITGIDPSEGQLAFARSRAEGASATYIVGNAMKLPFADASFDVSVMPLVIAFVPDPLAGVREMKRTTRKGGIVSAYMWDFTVSSRPGALITEALRKMGMPPDYPPSIDAALQDKMREIWTEAGLVDVETRELRIMTEFSSFEDFWSSNTLPVGPMGMFVSKLDDEKRDALKQEVRAALPGSADGPVSIPAWANAVKGRVG
jgi:ubiquinone/menaquinone biosynthesis C-methylase UbiE